MVRNIEIYFKIELSFNKSIKLCENYWSKRIKTFLIINRISLKIMM